MVSYQRRSLVHAAQAAVGPHLRTVQPAVFGPRPRLCYALSFRDFRA